MPLLLLGKASSSSFSLRLLASWTHLLPSLRGLWCWFNFVCLRHLFFCYPSFPFPLSSHSIVCRLYPKWGFWALLLAQGLGTKGLRDGTWVSQEGPLAPDSQHSWFRFGGQINISPNSHPYGTSGADPNQKEGLSDVLRVCMGQSPGFSVHPSSVVASL